MSNFLLLTLEWLEQQEGKRSSDSDDEFFGKEAARFKDFFEFLSAIEPSEFKQVVVSDLQKQVDLLKKQLVMFKLNEGELREDIHRKIFLKLYYYFYNLYHYLNCHIEPIENGKKKGAVYAVSQLLAAQFDTELYEDELMGDDSQEALKCRARVTFEDRIANLQITAKYIPEGFMVRMRGYCNYAADILLRALPAGTGVFVNPLPMSPETKAQLEQIVYEQLCKEMNVHMHHSRVRKQSVTSAATSPVPQHMPDDSELMNTSTHLGTLLQRELLKQPQKKPRSFKQKWRSLSFKKKCIFGGVLALGVIGVIAMGVLVPGSALITIPGAGVLTAKILAVLLGSIAITASAVVMQRHITRHKPTHNRLQATVFAENYNRFNTRASTVDVMTEHVF